MSLRKQFSPRKIRSGGKEEASSIPRSNSVQKIKEKILVEEDLVEKYAYKADGSKTAMAQKEPSTKNKENQPLPKADGSKIAMAQKEPWLPQKTFDLYDLSFLCEQHLLISFYGPIELHQQEIYSLQKEFIESKMEVYSEYNQEFEYNVLKFKLWYYKGEYFIPEEYYHVSGVLRQYFNITKFYVLFNTGEILLKEAKWCNFWFEEKLQKFFMGYLNKIKDEILDEDLCYFCNFTCPYRKRKQIDN